MYSTCASVVSSLGADERSPDHTRGAKYLQDQVRHLNSRVLSSLEKDIRMINDLIVSPREGAKAEAQIKWWCDTELSR